MRARLISRLLEPRDAASIAVFRIAFGIVMVFEAGRYLANGWVYDFWVRPSFHFTYPGFDWVHPWPGGWMYVHFLVLGVLAMYVAAGLFYRLAAALMAVAFAYVFLLDQTTYLNHWYLVILISFLMVAVPANRCWSFDAYLRPRKRSDFVPAWSLYLLRTQIGLVYFFAGIAKINGDWLRGEPMRTWLAERTDFPLLGPLFREEVVVYLMSYGALLLDLTAFPLLLWRRTRPFAFAALVGFHAMNLKLFDIGIFPWFMLAATTLFFDPSWPRRALAAGRRAVDRIRGSAAGAPAAKAVLPTPPATPAPRATRTQLAGFGLLGVYLAVQVLLPLRHFAYPGVVHWTEEGHRYAWHMKLRDKRARGIKFTATDPRTGRRWRVDPRPRLTTKQLRTMSTEPDMVRLFSHHIADELRDRGIARNAEVRAWIPVSLNARRYQLLIDPTVDLAAEPRWLPTADWILPLEPPRYP